MKIFCAKFKFGAVSTRRETDRLTSIAKRNAAPGRFFASERLGAGRFSASERLGNAGEN